MVNSSLKAMHSPLLITLFSLSIASCIHASGSDDADPKILGVDLPQKLDLASPFPPAIPSPNGNRKQDNAEAGLMTLLTSFLDLLNQMTIRYNSKPVADVMDEFAVLLRTATRMLHRADEGMNHPVSGLRRHGRKTYKPPPADLRIREMIRQFIAKLKANPNDFGCHCVNGTAVKTFEFVATTPVKPDPITIVSPPVLGKEDLVSGKEFKTRYLVPRGRSISDGLTEPRASWPAMIASMLRDAVSVPEPAVVAGEEQANVTIGQEPADLSTVATSSLSSTGDELVNATTELPPATDFPAATESLSSTNSIQNIQKATTEQPAATLFPVATNSSPSTAFIRSIQNETTEKPTAAVSAVESHSSSSMSLIRNIQNIRKALRANFSIPVNALNPMAALLTSLREYAKTVNGVNRRMANITDIISRIVQSNTRFATGQLKDNNWVYGEPVRKALEGYVDILHAASHQIVVLEKHWADLRENVVGLLRGANPDLPEHQRIGALNDPLPSEAKSPAVGSLSNSNSDIVADRRKKVVKKKKTKRVVGKKKAAALPAQVTDGEFTDEIISGGPVGWSAGGESVRRPILVTPSPTIATTEADSFDYVVEETVEEEEPSKQGALGGIVSLPDETPYLRIDALIETLQSALSQLMQVVSRVAAASPLG